MKFRFLSPKVICILTISAFFLSAGCDEIEPPYGNAPLVDCKGGGPATSYKIEPIPGFIAIGTSIEIKGKIMNSNGCIDTTFNGPITIVRTFSEDVNITDSIQGVVSRGIFNLGSLFFNSEGTFNLILRSDSLSITNQFEVTVIERKILIEDFTGHKCQACPLAHREAKRLVDVYGDQLVVIALHADFWALPSPPGAPSYTYDFRNQTATQVATDFGVIGQPFPKGMVNRMINPGTGSTWVMDWGSWEDRVDDWLNISVDAGILLDANFDSLSRLITANLTVQVLNNINQDCELAVYFIEDEIINWQKDQTASPADVSNYEHNHVLRGSLNGTYGENIGTLQAGQELSRSYSGTLTPSDANPDKVKLVAILSNSVTKEIIQVEEVSLK